MPESEANLELALQWAPYLDVLTFVSGLCALSLLPAGSPRLGARTEWPGVLAGAIVLAYLIGRVAFLCAGLNLVPWVAVASIPIVVAGGLRLLGPRSLAPREPLTAVEPPSSRAARILLMAGYVFMGASLLLFFAWPWDEPSMARAISQTLNVVVPIAAVVFMARVARASAVMQFVVFVNAMTFVAGFGHGNRGYVINTLAKLGIDAGPMPAQILGLVVTLATPVAFAFAFRRLADKRCLALAIASIPWAVDRAHFGTLATVLTSLGLIALVIGWAPAPALRAATKFAAVPAAYLALLWVQG